MSLRGSLRDFLRLSLSPQPLRRPTARLLRAALRRRLPPSVHRQLWAAAEQVVNHRQLSLRATTWFGAKVDCDLADMIPQRLFYTGVWEPDITRLFVAWLRRGDTVIDVGANMGYFSLLGAAMVGAGGAVFAVEAWPATAARLRANLQLNRVTHVEVVAKAVADQAGRLTLHGAMPGNSGATSRDAFAAARETAQVEAATLAELVPAAALAQAALIKIDIEGGEPAVLRQLAKALPTLAPRLTIVAEVTPAAFRAAGWPLEEVLAQFRQAGFTAQIIDNDYSLSADWWRFDPAQPPRMTPADQLPAQRFDLVLSRAG